MLSKTWETTNVMLELVGLLLGSMTMKWTLVDEAHFQDEINSIPGRREVREQPK